MNISKLDKTPLLLYLPQHLSKAKSFGGPLSSFMKELFQCPTGLYNRPPVMLISMTLLHFKYTIV